MGSTNIPDAVPSEDMCPLCGRVVDLLVRHVYAGGAERRVCPTCHETLPSGRPHTRGERGRERDLAGLFAYQSAIGARP